MTWRATVAVVAVLLAACVGGRRGRATTETAAQPATGPARPEGDATPPRPRARGFGAAPGDESGPGRFVSRGTEKSFYGATGGQYWYYLNLYYWAPEGLDTSDLWIREEIVERWTGLARWPDGTAAEAPPAKVTHEYWEVGSTGRTVGIDNHKDFFLAAENYCAGALEVTMTLELGRAQVKHENGEWGRPRATYVLREKNYGPGRRTGPKPSRFEPLAGEPITVWTYRIPWSSCPDRFTRSNWESLRTPSIAFVRRVTPPTAERPIVTTEPR